MKIDLLLNEEIIVNVTNKASTYYSEDAYLAIGYDFSRRKGNV